MARNDGIDRTSVRNLAVSDKAVGNTQQHNEREKDSYRNPDIIPQRAAWNVHFKKPTTSYTDLFAQLEADGTISTRGLKPDATHYCELVFDVLAAFRPEDLLFNHRHIDHMEVVVVDLPA